MTTTGTCKYCRQIRTIDHISKEITQLEKDEIATQECNCEGARAQRTREERIDRAKTAIRQIVERKDEKAAAIFRAGLEATADGRILSIQIKATGGMKYSMTLKGEKITIKSVETSEEESDGDIIE